MNKQNANNNELDLFELKRMISPYLIYIILISLITAMCSFIFTKVFVKPMYESSTMIVVNNRKGENQTITNDEINSAKNLADLYTVVIKSDSVLLPVVELVDPESTTSDLSKKVSVKSVNNTQVVRISVRDTDPEKALRYATEIKNVAPGVLELKVEAGSVNTISEPSIPTSPVSPNVKINVLLAFLIGFAGSTGVIVLLQLSNRTVTSEEDINKMFDLPVIGVIPNIESLR